LAPYLGPLSRREGYPYPHPTSRFPPHQAFWTRLSVPENSRQIYAIVYSRVIALTNRLIACRRNVFILSDVYYVQYVQWFRRCDL